jgi:hypothetical protein
MPGIFEYLGILIFFYSNEHEPIHVHGKCGGFESKAEFHIVNGIVTYPPDQPHLTPINFYL